MNTSKISNYFIAAAMSAICLLMASCGSSRNATTARRTSTSGTTAVSRPRPPQKIDMSHVDSKTTSALLSEAQTWLGTRYVYGGNDRSGVDCSGFVVQVYDKALGIKLPRTSVQQQQYCSNIDRSQLMQGDLVFFTVRGGSDVGHVGIYIGNGNMIHASSSGGVVISSLDSPYYVNNYISSGRIDKFYAMAENDRSKRSKSTSKQPQQEVLIASASKAEEPMMPRSEAPKPATPTPAKRTPIVPVNPHTAVAAQAPAATYAAAVQVAPVVAPTTDEPIADIGSALDSPSEFFD